MPALRRHRLATVLLTLLSLLFMQLALAGYSCADVESRVREAAAMAEAGTPYAGSMPIAIDDEESALCHAHCAAGHQASDTQPIQLPVMAPASGLAFDRPAFATPVRGAQQPSLLARSTAPPLAIRNCCLRI